MPNHFPLSDIDSPHMLRESCFISKEKNVHQVLLQAVGELLFILPWNASLTAGFAHRPERRIDRSIVCVVHSSAAK